MALHKSAIIKTLIDAANAGPFRPVDWRDDIRQVSESRTIKPSTVLCNDTGSFWGPPERNRRNPRLRERTEWRFQLIVDFSETEVDLEEFEELMERGLVVLADADSGRRQVIIEPESCEVSHPPRNESQSGTRVTYVVLAHLAHK